MTDDPKTSSIPHGDDEASLPPTVSQDPNRGRRIGRFHIKSAIASGGMGTVYLAVQDEPRRHVALKLMKHGIASRSALRRFEFESQILGRLHHPGIAEIYEAGTWDEGSGRVPYFAMEYIPNANTLTRYAASKSLSVRKRLELFARICEALHHGHQRGIIHRDLKPDNILIDSEGNPKIIDFGVARATDSDMAVTTLQTDIGQLIGTLQYMSPEQCDADPHDIDIRSDVYALGVILYELLCDRVPYDVGRLAIHEAARVIREEDPARPSTINRTLRADVETIALKAMAKERQQRYRSAIELSDDIGRYLRDEPILARRPSVGDQMARLARRHKAAVVGAAAVLLALVAGTVVATTFAIREHWANALAKESLRDAELAREDAQHQADMALSCSPDPGRGPREARCGSSCCSS